MCTSGTLVVAIVGVDGCGKSSAFRGVLDTLAQRIDVVGVGDEILAGAPGSPLRVRTDLPFSRATALASRTAKRVRGAGPYRQLKTLDLIGRSNLRDHVVRDEVPAVLLTDGDPLVNTLAWSVARHHRAELQADDGRVLDVLCYLAGDRPVPLREMPYYLRHAWQLALVNRLHLARFRRPDLVVHLEIDGATAIGRIRRRGRPLQPHETEAALTDLGHGYERVCQLLEGERRVEVLRVPAERMPADEVVQTVAEVILERLSARQEAPEVERTAGDIDVVATTMSGSLRDQRKVGRIGPEFRRMTTRQVRVHVAHSHREARMLTQGIVARGGRLIVSAGGAGTFNAVLEGCHGDGPITAGLRLAFLRKGSADLIGKRLRIPDDLPAAVAAICDGIEHDRCVTADILTVEAVGPDGHVGRRHLVGFGGLGIFGDVPRFTESRAVKLYKGILSTILGDYGPFFVGLALATMWWYGQRLRGRVPVMRLELDGETVGPDHWSTVIVVSGDLGSAFPLGRAMSWSSGTFRVVALRDVGLLRGLRQLRAAGSGRVLDEPVRYAGLVREVRTFVVEPRAAVSSRTTMVNVDGLAMMTRGSIRFDVSGQVELIAGPADVVEPPDRGPT